jgi:hypothetical protein
MLESSECWNITKGNSDSIIVVIHSETDWIMMICKTYLRPFLLLFAARYSHPASGTRI